MVKPSKNADYINKRMFVFIEYSPTAFHITKNIETSLLDYDFIKLREGQEWNLERGKSYLVTRNDSSIIAFKIPMQEPKSFMIAASHSDSPCFKLKDNPTVTENGYSKFSCEKYGGMINNTWLDRPLSVAGRVVYAEDDHIKSTLVDFRDPIAMIPNVAIHLNRKANEESSLNPAVDLVPFFNSDNTEKTFKEQLGEYIDVKEEDILSFDLFLYNAEKPISWQNYISAPRLDDLQCVCATMDAFIPAEAVESIPVFAVFDNEEVGSSTKQGADSDFLSVVINKISASLNIDIVSSSLMLSCDNGHAVHPNHPELTDKNNSVKLNGGIVIKHNANQKYCTDAVSSALVKVLCDRAGVPYQCYSNRSDILGGSTLGNIANTHLSVVTADIGLAQLAMHSAYETAGRFDTEYMVELLSEFFKSSLTVSDNNTYKI